MSSQPALQLYALQPLLADHRFDKFACGEAVLEECLKRRAITNRLSGVSRTFVLADHDKCVHGFYAIAAGAVSHHMATSSVSRNVPDSVLAMVLPQLAADSRAQGIKLDASLLQEAVNRAVTFSQNAGIRALPTKAEWKMILIPNRLPSCLF